MHLLEPITVTIKGKHDTGKSTLANLIKMSLEEMGYDHVSVEDVKPLPQEDKFSFQERFVRNRQRRPVKIKVELVE